MEPSNYFPNYRLFSIVVCLSAALYISTSNGLLPFFALLGAGIGQLIYGVYRSLKVDPKGRAVFITGCDTGFGHSLAKLLHSLEFTVFASVIDKQSDGALALQKLGRETNRLYTIQMNVTSQRDVDEARQYIENNLPEHGLWALVNNAGIAGGYSYLEWSSMEEFERTMSVNLFGVARVTKAFLPLIRKSQGRVVNMSSVLGCSADHYAGPYSISKFGVEAFSDILRLEMRQFNVRVCIIEPGNFISATSIIAGPNSLQTLGRQSWEKLDPSLKKDYGEERFEKMIGLVQVLRDFSAKDNGIVVKAMADAIYRKFPKDRNMPTIHPIDKTVTFIGYYLPSFFSDIFKVCLIKAVYFLFKK